MPSARRSPLLLAGLCGGLLALSLASSQESQAQGVATFRSLMISKMDQLEIETIQHLWEKFEELIEKCGSRAYLYNIGYEMVHEDRDAAEELVERMAVNDNKKINQEFDKLFEKYCKDRNDRRRRKTRFKKEAQSVFSRSQMGVISQKTGCTRRNIHNRVLPMFPTYSLREYREALRQRKRRTVEEMRREFRARCTEFLRSGRRGQRSPTAG